MLRGQQEGREEEEWRAHTFLALPRTWTPDADFRCLKRQQPDTIIDVGSTQR